MRMILYAVAWAAMLGAADNVWVESFDQVWQTIEDKHYSAAELEKLPNGKSWKEVRGLYRPRVEAARSADEARAAMREMIELLGRSHYAIAGPEASQGVQRRAGGPAQPGFSVEVVEGKILVSRVAAGTPAAQAGIRLGWELLQVEDVPLAPMLAGERKPIRLQQLLKAQLGGYHGQALRYAFAGGRVVTLTLPKPDGSTGFGFVQGLSVEREFRREGAAKDVGYFRLSMFLDAVRVLPEFERAVKSCGDCRGFVLDLRGNPGGIAIMANALSGWFISESGVKLGTMYQRDLTLNFAVIPRLEGFTGKLAILQDGASASTSEILAGGLQNLKRARVFGGVSAGAALPSLIEQLPSGDLFQYAVANYVSEDGRVLEGRGVKPDVEVKHTRASLDAQRDRVLEAAIDWIYGKSRLPGAAAR